MLLRIISCICFLFSLTSTWAQGEPYRFTTFGTRDGLPEKFIYTATQDHSGFIWLGTANGIYRYDGVQFEKFNNVSGFPFGLVYALHVQSDTELWVGGVSSFSAYDPAQRKTIPFVFPEAQVKEVRESNVHNFFKDSKSRVWIGTKKSFCYHADVANRTLRHQKRSATALGDAHNDLVGMKEGLGKLWILTPWGIFSRPVETMSIPVWKLELELPGAYFTDFVLDEKRNCIWLSSQVHGLGNFNLQNTTFNWLGLKAKTSVDLETLTSITALTWKSENELWFSYGQLGYFDISKGTARLLSEKDKGNFAYRTQKVARFFRDREKNLWICSYNGLSAMYWQNQQVFHVPLFDTAANFIIEPKMVVESQDGRYLYIANTVSRGLLQYDQVRHTIEFLSGKGAHPIIAVSNFPDGMVLGSDGEELYAFQGKQVKKLLWLDQRSMPVKGVKKILSGESGKKVLIVAEGVWYEYLPGRSYLQKVVSEELALPEAKKLPWIPIFVDARNNVWMKAQGFLYCKNTIQGKDILLDHKSYPALDLSQVGGMEQDYEGVYWLATKTNGLYKLVPADNTTFSVTHINAESLFRMPSDGCTRISKDRKGRLWVGSLNGLFCLDPKTLQVSTILKEQHGLTHDYIDVEMSITPTDKLIVSNYGVLNWIDLKHFKTNTSIPQPKLGSLKSMGKFINATDFSRQSKFSFQENYFEFHLVPGLLNNSNDYSYAYKLEGADRDWVVGGTRSYVSYSGLGDGKYQFLARVCNNDGVWSTPVSLYSFSIAPPFWKTWWFITIALLVVALLVLWRYQVKINSVRIVAQKEAEFQKQVSVLELKALRAQMNPHFVFNALNSIQKFILEKDHITAAQYLTKFSRLIRLILEQSDQHLITLDKELDLLRHYLEIEAMRFDKKFEWEIKVAPDIASGNTILPTLLIQPFVENAIWHGLLHKEGPGKLQIAFHMQAPYLYISIEDNGVGRAAALEFKSKAMLKNKSLGMQITRDRMTVIDALLGIKTQLNVLDLTTATGAASGTRVEILLPSNLNEYAKSYTGR